MAENVNKKNAIYTTNIQNFNLKQNFEIDKRTGKFKLNQMLIYWCVDAFIGFWLNVKI